MPSDPATDQPRPRPSGETLHLVPAPHWEAQRDAASYLPEQYEQDGFIHCTDGDTNLLGVANAFYRSDPRPYVVLTLNVEKLTSPVRYDDVAAIYPHIYGPLNLDAVVDVRRAVRLADGSFASFE